MNSFIEIWNRECKSFIPFGFFLFVNWTLTGSQLHNLLIFKLSYTFVGWQEPISSLGFVEISSSYTSYLFSFWGKFVVNLHWCLFHCTIHWKYYRLILLPNISLWWVIDRFIKELLIVNMHFLIILTWHLTKIWIPIRLRNHLLRKYSLTAWSCHHLHWLLHFSILCVWFQ